MGMQGAQTFDFDAIDTSIFIQLTIFPLIPIILLAPLARNRTFLIDKVCSFDRANIKNGEVHEPR